MLAQLQTYSAACECEQSDRLRGVLFVELTQQVADHRFGIQLFSGPALARRTPCLFVRIDRVFIALQVLLPRTDLRLALSNPFHERLPFLPELLTLFVEADLRLLQFAELLLHRVAIVAVVFRQQRAGFIDALPRQVAGSALHELGERLFHRDAHFERLPVGLFQLASQAIEPCATRFQIFGVQREHVLLTSQVGLLNFAVLLPGFAFESQALAIALHLFLVCPAGAIQLRPFPIERVAPLIEQVSHPLELLTAANELHLSFFQPRLSALLFQALRRLGGFEVLPRPLQVVLLKLQAILEQHAFLTELGLQTFALCGQLGTFSLHLGRMRGAFPLQVLFVRGPFASDVAFVYATFELQRPVVCFAFECQGLVVRRSFVGHCLRVSGEFSRQVFIVRLPFAREVFGLAPALRGELFADTFLQMPFTQQ